MANQHAARSSGIADSAGKHLAAKRVLIAEDEPLIALALAESVDELGYKVCATVDSQEAAIAAVSRFKPAVVLLDYRLAGGDGLAAARVIRAAHDVPIIFLTAYVSGVAAEVASIPRCLLIGKPVTPGALQRALARALAMN